MAPLSITIVVSSILSVKYPATSCALNLTLLLVCDRYLGSNALGRSHIFVSNESQHTGRSKTEIPRLFPRIFVLPYSQSHLVVRGWVKVFQL